MSSSKNSNSGMAVPEAKEAMRQFKEEVASELGVNLKNGYNGDAARTYLVGNVTDEAKELVEVTKQAFFEAIKYAKAGNRVGDISNAVDTYVRKFGFSEKKGSIFEIDIFSLQRYGFF